MASLLVHLLSNLPGFELHGSDDGVVIEQVTADSRLVAPRSSGATGSLFVAVPGATVDGHRFIEDALSRGAVAVVGMADPRDAMPASLGGALSGIPYVRVPDSRAALARLAAAFFGFPSRHLRLVGVTGTDGKTTTTNLIYRILLSAGWRPGMISTLAARVGPQETADADLDTGFHVTTPEAVEVQRYLAQMLAAGCDAAVLEATSHGLQQGRLDACDFDVAVVTNVTHEHLDYHGSWEAYLEAKALLFHSLRHAAAKPNQPKTAILNADDDAYHHLRRIPVEQQLTYGMGTTADLRAENVRFYPDRTTFTVRTPGGSAPIETWLVGDFNVYNCLAALGVAIALGVPLPAAARGITALREVTGRMQRIDRGQDFLAMVDFAHTPASLRRALETARRMVVGRVIVVFGSAGLRDVEKRRLMPAVAAQLADVTLLTAEDPRTESLSIILDEMVQAGLEAGGELGASLRMEPDRATAILQAVTMAQTGDAVLVCGKGHEGSMCFGTVEHPWSDQAVLSWAVERRLGLAHGDPPFLLPTARDRTPILSMLGSRLPDD